MSATKTVKVLGVLLVLALAAGTAWALHPMGSVQARVARTRVVEVPANSESVLSVVSANGRYVAYLSSASNLVSGDTNGAYDVFVRDRVTGKTTRVSVSNRGKQGDRDSGYSFGLAISANGRFVAFDSDATNLVAGDTNGQGPDGESCPDVFVRDRAKGTTERVNVSSVGQQARTRGFLACSGMPSISADGRYVAFVSQASNLVAGDTNRCDGNDYCDDVLMRDRVSGKTTRVSVSTTGKQGNRPSVGPAISANGRFVAFATVASYPALEGGVFVRDRKPGKTTRVAEGSSPAISATGRYVAFASNASNLVAGDTNKTADVFVRDRVNGKTTRVSMSSAGKQANRGSSHPTISANGRYVAFVSDASTLVPGDSNVCTFPDSGNQYPCPDAFVYDRTTRKVERVSVSSAGEQADSGGWSAVISASGRYVTFISDSTNLVAGDTNRQPDVFLRDRLNGTTTLVSVGQR